MVFGSKTNYPCTRDCERRTPFCHSTCQKYLDAVEGEQVRKAAARKDSEALNYQRSRVCACGALRSKRKMEGRFHER